MQNFDRNIFYFLFLFYFCPSFGKFKLRTLYQTNNVKLWLTMQW